MNRCPVTKTAAENPVGDNQDGLTASPLGPVHAKCAGACGTFTVTRVS